MGGGVFTGSPRLLLRSAPWAVGVLLVKLLLQLVGWEPLELSPLLTGTIAAEVFIVGFLLAGVSSDFKEAERLPGEVAASLETIADECLIIRQEHRLPEAEMCLADLLALGRSIREWLAWNRGFDEVMADIRVLNQYFIAFTPFQAGYTQRLKGEQANLRRLVIRMDTMRRTSYVAAGYLIAEVTAAVLFVILVLTDLGAMAPTLVLVGVVSYLLIYMLRLIRDLDNPFEYADGTPGAADVSLDVLIHHEHRMKDLIAEARPLIEADQIPEPTRDVVP